MDWSEHDELCALWNVGTKTYVDAINQFVATGAREGWDKAGPEPEDQRDPLGVGLVHVIREANEAGEQEELRKRFPPGHRPLTPFMDDQAQHMRNVVCIDDERVCAGVGEFWKPQGVMIFDATHCEPVPGALAVARSRDYSHFALLYSNRIDVTAGWGGNIVASWPVPEGNEGIAPTIVAPAAENTLVIDLQLTPDAQAAVVVMPEGVFRCSAEGVRRLFPSKQGMKDIIKDVMDEQEGELAFKFDMLHARISPKGDLVALGSQSSQHELVTLDGERVAIFGPVHSEYPHHAGFDDTGEYLAVNSCHFYNGASVVAAVDSLRGMDGEPYEDDPRLKVLEPESRVYSSVFAQGLFVLGDAYGYLRARTPEGENAWTHFCGSTLFGMDISPNQRRLVVGAASGFLHLIDLPDPDAESSGERDPFQIGTSHNHERVRWICWRGEEPWRW